jgi:hypothetical protein
LRYGDNDKLSALRLQYSGRRFAHPDQRRRLDASERRRRSGTPAADRGRGRCAPPSARKEKGPTRSAACSANLTPCARPGMAASIALSPLAGIRSRLWIWSKAGAPGRGFPLGDSTNCGVHPPRPAPHRAYCPASTPAIGVYSRHGSALPSCLARVDQTRHCAEKRSPPCDGAANSARNSAILAANVGDAARGA